MSHCFTSGGDQVNTKIDFLHTVQQLNMQEASIYPSVLTCRQLGSVIEQLGARLQPGALQLGALQCP